MSFGIIWYDLWQAIGSFFRLACSLSASLILLASSFSCFLTLCLFSLSLYVDLHVCLMMCLFILCCVCTRLSCAVTACLVITHNLLVSLFDTFPQNDLNLCVYWLYIFIYTEIDTYNTYTHYIHTKRYINRRDHEVTMTKHPEDFLQKTTHDLNKQALLQLNYTITHLCITVSPRGERTKKLESIKTEWTNWQIWTKRSLNKSDQNKSKADNNKNDNPC